MTATIETLLNRPDPDLARVLRNAKKFSLLFLFSLTLGKYQVLVIFAKRDALCPRAYFTIFQKDTKIKLKTIGQKMQCSSSFVYFQYCFSHSLRPYTHVGH